MTVSYLSVRGVSKYYKKEKAVDSVDLEVQRGKFLTILGPSGSGKTSLLKLIAGFEKLNTGSISLDDQNISDKMPYERNIGMVFQNYALFPHMTIEQNIAYPLKLRKMKKGEIKEKVSDIMELVNLSGFEDRKPDQLSGGQQQRVALARAIVFSPPLLLLDEPLGALDKNLRERMQIEIRRIQQEIGITTISVTHDQEEALTMSDEICVMNNGKLEQIASPEEIYQRPANKFVADFIGEVNLIAGEMITNENNSISKVKLLGDSGVVLQVKRDQEMLEERVFIVLRPENIHLILDDSSAYENSLEVTVQEKVYIGEAIKLKCKTSFDQDITIKSHTNNSDVLQIGKTVKVGWNTKDSSLIAYEE